MAQPPDGRRPMPWEPSEPVPPAEAPTVAWTPPDGAADPAVPHPAAPATPPAEPLTSPAEPLTPPDPSGAPAAAPADTPSEPASPLISWSPSGGTAPPASPPGSPAAGEQAPVVGWAAPSDARQASPIAGYVVAGTGSRVVAYIIDGVLLAIVSLVIASIADPDLFDPTTPPVATRSMPLLLTGLIGIGIDYAYYVGLWTSRGRATLGMRLLRIHVIDQRRDEPLKLVPASARWLLVTGAFSILLLLPIAQEIMGLAIIIWSIVLLASVINNPLRQGIHDQAAGSLVVQRVGVRSNAAVVGCLLLVLLFVVWPIVALIALGPQMEEFLLEVGQSI